MAGRQELVFVALGGVGEIGMNMGLYGVGPPSDRRWIAVDCGVTFAGPDLPGIDLILPDVAFLEKIGSRLLGIVITHAHEDHYGALAALWPRLRVPVYASPFAVGLLRAKHGAEAASKAMAIQLIEAGQRWTIGPFDLEAIAVAHSIPESMALAIRTPLGTVLHTGDWKLDADPQIGPPTDEQRLIAIGREGIVALVCDSTNAPRAGGSVSEGEVANAISALVASAEGRVAFTLFSSNVARILSIGRAAQTNGRDVFVSGRSLRRVIDVAQEHGYLVGASRFRDIDELGQHRSRDAVLILSGSQGEPRAALSRIADGADRRVRLGKGDLVVFSSRAIPGNERRITDIVNQLTTTGVTVVTDSDPPVHASGHPRRDELLKLYRWLDPKILVPVHGEAVHLKAQAALAREAGIKTILDAPNGTLARLAPSASTIANAVPVGRVYRDGWVIGDHDTLGIQQRRRMAYGGHIAISVALDKGGEMAGGPMATLTGIPRMAADGRPMAEIVAKAAQSALAGIPRPRRRDPVLVSEAVRRAVRAEVADSWGKKPVCVVQVLVV